MRIAVIADSHLSPRTPECVANWQAAGRAVQRLQAELTVHLGDICFDAPSSADDLDFAAALLAEWPTPMRCIPGNHDVGDGSGEGPLRMDLLERYRSLFGPDRWMISVGDWQLIGINAQLFGTSSEAEMLQWEWLEQHALWTDSSMQTILLSHRPIHRPEPGEAGRNGRYVPDAAAERLMQGPLRDHLRMVMSGHTHQWLDRRGPALRHVWMPSSAFILPDAMQSRVGEKVVGIGVLDVGGPRAEFDLLMPDGMLRHDVTPLASRLGPHGAASAAASGPAGCATPGGAG